MKKIKLTEQEKALYANILLILNNESQISLSFLQRKFFLSVEVAQKMLDVMVLNKVIKCVKQNIYEVVKK